MAVAPLDAKKVNKSASGSVGVEMGVGTIIEEKALNENGDIVLKADGTPQIARRY
jgi:hypothetical protein